ncbi:MAG: ABC exporter membrane fusion protein [Chroococcidiopsidaceae cyanobacterium CP_BM_RX_35]|nr:ABC exporter membrane fusion protein [Chroococcidiopsidaceae cyanobacterium CP_BM_RX_35]
MEKYRVIEQLPLKLTQRWGNILAIVITMTVGQAVAFYWLRPWLSDSQPSTAVAPNTMSALNTVAALGRLEPQGDVIQLSASSSAQSKRVAQLLVKQGDKVHVGQIVAILDSHDRLRATLEQAQKQVKVAQAHLAQVQTGAKPIEITVQQANINSVKAQLQGEINTQEATIAQLEPEQRHAQTEYHRYLGLYRNGAIAAATLESKRLAVAMLKQQIAEARTNQQRSEKFFQQQTAAAKGALSAIKQVRPADLEEAQAEVEKAMIEVKQAQANLDFATVRSPIDGQVLQLHTLAGEVVSDKGQGIVELGQTDQMYVVAEVYESDIAKVHLGQKATLTSQSHTLPETLHGTVDQIGLKIGKKDMTSNDPAVDIDARVVEVKIRLAPADSLRVARLTNMQMQVMIHI